MDQKNLASIPVRSRGSNLIMAALALVAGGAIYLFLRTSDFVFFRWIETTGLPVNWIAWARDHLFYGRSPLPAWIIYSLPGGLWAFAYTVLILTIWKNNRSRVKYFWMATIPALVFGFESLQLTGIVPGTFCLQDMMLGMAGIGLGFLLVTDTRKKNIS